MIKLFNHLPIILLALLLVACNQMDGSGVTVAGNTGDLTATDAAEFVEQSEQQLAILLQENERMAWVYSNFITEDTEQLATSANKKYTALQVELAVEAAKYYEIDNISADIAH